MSKFMTCSHKHTAVIQNKNEDYMVHERKLHCLSAE